MSFLVNFGILLLVVAYCGIYAESAAAASAEEEDVPKMPTFSTVAEERGWRRWFCRRYPSLCPPRRTRGGGFLMTVGGSPATNLVELFEARNPRRPRRCNTTLALFPIKVWGAVGGVPKKKPTVCGGIDNSTSDATAACYQFNFRNNTWTKSGNMTARRAFAGYDFSASWGLVAAGGLSSVMDPINAIGIAESSVEATFDGVTFTSLPNLPVVRAGHCLNIVSKKFLFFAGGEGSNSTVPSNMAGYLRRGASQWTLLPNMTFARRGLSCGITNVRGRREIVAAGGDNSGLLNVVEIFSLSSLTWRTASPLPISICGAFTAQFFNTFVMVGGFNMTAPTSAIQLFKGEKGLKPFAMLDAPRLDVASFKLARRPPTC